MRVRQLLGNSEGGTLTVPETMPVPEFTAALASSGASAAPVVGPEGEFSGVVSTHDLVRGFHLHGCRLCEMVVGDLMTRDAMTCDPDFALTDLAAMMSDHRIRHVPVLEARALVGFVSIDDVTATRVEQLELDNEALREMLVNYETIG